SFVSPRWVPQLADATEVYQAVAKAPGVVYSALVPNDKGMRRALDCGVTHVAIFTAASETFNQHNINASIDESLERFKPVMARAAAAGVPVRGYVSTSFGCPYEGDVAPAAVARVSRLLADLGVEEISLGDTHGAAVPNQVPEVLAAVGKVVPLELIAVHFHDTHGRALANVFSALLSGVSVVDSSAGGLGGCPYSPGASGNLATEDLIAMLIGMGIETGVDLDKLTDASFYVEEALGRALPSRHLQAARAKRKQRA
ncbi:MAG: hydroxymethylglutaryl-CoA lyase, partial [Myxococcota bacterium]